MGYTGLPVLKTGWATGPLPLPRLRHRIPRTTTAPQPFLYSFRGSSYDRPDRAIARCRMRVQTPSDLLATALAGLPPAPIDERLLVGHGDLDDAAVWQIDDHLLLVQTVDFFTPIVDDPYTFGRIAATNAFSDVYAMGAIPAFALNIAAFPKTLSMEILSQIMRGGRDIATAAGAIVAGGHSIDDPEPKYGMVVTGFTHPERIWTNSGARPGDVLVLGKPIGTGIITTALKHGEEHHQATNAAITSMTTLNAQAAEQLRPHNPSAVTDVTGFGLIGHSHEVAQASQVSVHINAAAVPLLPGTRTLAKAGYVPGGTQTNLASASQYARFAGRLEEIDRLLLCDAQTSGGLLAAISPKAATTLGWPIVGSIQDGPSGTVTIA